MVGLYVRCQYKADELFNNRARVKIGTNPEEIVVDKKRTIKLRFDSYGALVEAENSGSRKGMLVVKIYDCENYEWVKRRVAIDDIVKSQEIVRRSLR